jgi:flagellum-specific ATP synthase
VTSRMMISAQRVLGAIDVSSLCPRRVGALVSHQGVMVEAADFPHAIGTAVRISARDGSIVRGEVVGFRGQNSVILPFGSDAALATGARVDADGAGAKVACGVALLGRVIDAHGDPLDGGGAIRTTAVLPLAGRPDNPLNRGRVTRPFDVGVRSINGLVTLGEGQRVAIIAGSGVGKSVLIGQMLAGADCDVIVVGLVGERAREVSDFVETKLPPTAKARSVVVAVPADQAPLLRLRAAMRATAIAEYFRSTGQRVLLIIDSLTRVAHAQREIGLALGEPPTMKGYPPSALSLIPRLVERAGTDRQTGGSITALYTVLADGGDMDDPIVDAARAIVDGHILLSRTLAEQGIYPAIDVSRSLSRTMVDVVDPAHASAAAQFRQHWSTYDDNRDLMLMGAYSPGNDVALDEAIAQRGAMLAFLRQATDEAAPLASSRNALITGFGG